MPWISFSLNNAYDCCLLHTDTSHLCEVWTSDRNACRHLFTRYSAVMHMRARERNKRVWERIMLFLVLRAAVRYSRNLASLLLHLLVLVPSPLCFSIILFFLLLMCLSLLPFPLFPHSSVILSLFRSLSPSHDGTAESRPPKLMTIISLRNVAAGLALYPTALAPFLLLPLSSSLFFLSFSQGSY